MKNSNIKKINGYDIAMCRTGQKNKPTSEYFSSLELYATSLV